MIRNRQENLRFSLSLTFYDSASDIMKLCIFLGIFASFAAFISAHASRRAASPSVAAQIRFLLDEEKTLRQKLETRVQKLRQQAANLNNAIGKTHTVIFLYFRLVLQEINL